MTEKIQDCTIYCLRVEHCSHTAGAFAFVVFRILSVTCSLTRALSQSHAHAQQLFSASTPGQVLAPRVCITARVHICLFRWVEFFSLIRNAQMRGRPRIGSGVPGVSINESACNERHRSKLE